MRPERAIGAVTALVVGAVTALAFAQSFHALRSFAEAQRIVPVGWGWMFAATIDGFVLAALLTSAATARTSRLRGHSDPAAIEQPDRATPPGHDTPEAAALPTGMKPPLAPSGSQAEAAPSTPLGMSEASSAEAAARQQARQFYE